MTCSDKCCRGKLPGRVEVEKPSGWEGFIIGVLFLLVIFA